MKIENHFDSSDVAELEDAAGLKPYRSNLCAGSNPASLESNNFASGDDHSGLMNGSALPTSTERTDRANNPCAGNSIYEILLNTNPIGDGELLERIRDEVPTKPALAATQKPMASILTVGSAVAAPERTTVKPLAPTVNDPRHILTYAAAMTSALNQAQGIIL